MLSIDDAENGGGGAEVPGTPTFCLRPTQIRARLIRDKLGGLVPADPADLQLILVDGKCIAVAGLQLAPRGKSSCGGHWVHAAGSHGDPVYS